jgi:hypothetical protein
MESSVVSPEHLPNSEALHRNDTATPNQYLNLYIKKIETEHESKKKQKLVITDPLKTT